MKPILIVAPHPKIAYIAERVSQRHTDVDVRLALLHNAIDVARQDVRNGVEILISRGGTAQILEKELVSMPIVELPVTPYDLMKAIHRAKSFGNNIIILGFDRVIQGVEQISHILNVNLTVKKIQNEEDGRKYVLRRLKGGSLGDVLMGGAVAEKLAIEFGIATVFLETNETTIEKAIQEARRILYMTRKEKQKMEQFRAILHYINQGVIAIDSDGKVTTFNPIAAKMTGINRAAILNHRLEDFIPGSRLVDVMRQNRAELGRLEKIGDVMVLTNRVPLIVGENVLGAVATFEDVTKIQEYERKIRHKLRKKGHIARYTFSDILGESTAITRAIKLAKSFSRVESTVLIVGESGTGKEMFAQSIHNAGKRAGGPFVAMNCAAIPETLLESELFGYEGGAFTGARKSGKSGLFLQAHKGTIFLDEIGDIPNRLQARLLRVIQEKEIMPIGSERVIPVDVRIVAATNKNLSLEVNRGAFRSDLYYRLAVLNLQIPSLRNRKEDISLLVEHFLKLHNDRFGKLLEIQRNALQALENFEWPGNVRQLENIIERICVIGNRIITLADVNDALLEASLPLQSSDRDNIASIYAIKKDHAMRVLSACGGNRTIAAKKLGISRTSLWRILKN